MRMVASQPMSPIPSASAYIVAARRSALGRIGGLHKSRRLEELTAPVVAAALADAKIAPDRVEEIIIGNASAGGNPARIIALAAGLPETAPALTLDRQCGSGLDAILTAVRTIAAGDADVIVAGGAESSRRRPGESPSRRAFTSSPISSASTRSRSPRARSRCPTRRLRRLPSG